jgi:L,D-transpeptidase catalytic domain
VGARFTVALVAAAVAGLLWGGLAGSRRTATNAAVESFAALRASPAPALKIGAPRPLDSGRFLSRWATVRTSLAAHVRPTIGSPVIAYVAEQTPEGTPNAMPVLRSTTDRRGGVWVEVRLPSLPNGEVGWVPRRALGGYETVDTHLIVDRTRLRATLYRAGTAVFSASVGVGTRYWPTPAGEFMIRSELTRYASPFYGPVAFGTTARSVLTDWPDGGFVGIHGTSEPQLIPGRVSHGCIRMRNEDVVRLAALMPVGTPLTIR